MHMRRLHRWLGVLLSVILAVVAVSGLALRHPDLAARVLREPSQPGALADRTTALAADPRVPGRFLVGTARGVFESRDGGRTWRDVLLQAPASHVVSVAFDASSPQRVLIATAAGGVFVSEDGGTPASSQMTSRGRTDCLGEGYQVPQGVGGLPSRGRRSPLKGYEVSPRGGMRSPPRGYEVSRVGSTSAG